MKYTFEEPNYNINDDNPYIDYHRCIILKSISDHFVNILNSLDINVNSKYHNVRYFQTMFSKFYFLQFTNSQSDPILIKPPFIYNQLKRDLLNLLSSGTYDFLTKISIIHNIITKCNLENKFENGLETLSKKIKNIPKKYYIKSKFNNNTTLKYKSTVQLTLIPLNETIELKRISYTRFQKQFKHSNQSLLNIYIWRIIFRYNSLYSYHNQLSVNPNIYKRLRNTLNCESETFASSINNYFNNYCSLFWDIEKYFGSNGMFFQTTFKEGTYTVNPPFDELLIYYMALHLVKCLNETTENLTFIFWLPIWDINGLKEINYNSSYIITDDYGDFVGLKILEKSGFLKKQILIPYENIQYLDHNHMKKINICPSYCIILSNYDNPNFNQINNIISL